MRSTPTRLLLRILIGLGLAFAPLAGARGATMVLGFDDLNTANSVVPNGYGGLSWQGLQYASTLPEYLRYPGGFPLTGYDYGTVSFPNIAWGEGFGSVYTQGTPFDVLSVYMTAAFTDGLVVQVQGFGAARSQVYDRSFTLNHVTPTFAQLDFFGVYEVDFTFVGVDPWFALDDLTVRIPAPEPASITLLGVVALAGWQRSRRPADQ